MSNTFTKILENMYRVNIMSTVYIEQAEYFTISVFGDQVKWCGMLNIYSRGRYGIESIF